MCLGAGLRSTNEVQKITDQYVDDILSGKVAVCDLVKRTYIRHRKDLEKSKTDVFEYTFDIKRATEVIRFLELLPHISGALAGKKFILENWQIAMISVLYGWVHKETNFRRFTKAQLFLPRKNGKSFLLSGLALYHLIDPRDGASQVYSVSVKRDAAKLTWDVSRQMLISDPSLAKAFGLTYNTYRIHQEKSGSYFKALSKDTHGQSTDGISSSFVIFDEVHLIEHRAMYDSLITSTGARAEPLVFAITTAGFSRTSVAFQLYEYGKQIVNNEIEDDSIFFLAYTLDPEDLADEVKLLTDQSLWYKANPNLGVSCYVQDMKNLATQALNTNTERPNFLTKRLNVWASSSSVYIPIEKLVRVQQEINIEDFRGETAIIGVDIATRNDFASIGIFFPATEERPAVMIDKVFLNKQAIESDMRFIEYRDAGLIEQCGEVATDFDQILEYLTKLKDIIDIQSIFYDPFSLEHFAQMLKKRGFSAYKHYQNHRSYNVAMQELASLVNEQNIIISNSKLLTWQFQNVVAHRNADNLLRPTKVSPHQKIDSVVALLMAMGGYLRSAEREQENIWDNYVFKN